MNEETKKLIEEQLDTLPSELRGAINSVPWQSLVRDIAKENNLSEEQTDLLEVETALIVHFLEKTDDYALNLMKELGIDQEVAIKVATSVAERIFNVIMGNLENNMPNPSTTTDPHPATIPGETAHEVPHIEPTINDQRPTTKDTRPITNPEPQTPRPAGPQYPGGQDPYREPLQ